MSLCKRKHRMLEYRRDQLPQYINGVPFAVSIVNVNGMLYVYSYGYWLTGQLDTYLEEVRSLAICLARTTQMPVRYYCKSTYGDRFEYMEFNFSHRPIISRCK